MGTATRMKIGDSSQEMVVSKWKAVSASLKTISEEAQNDPFMMSRTKNNTGIFFSLRFLINNSTLKQHVCVLINKMKIYTVVRL